MDNLIKVSYVRQHFQVVSGIKEGETILAVLVDLMIQSDNDLFPLNEYEREVLGDFTGLLAAAVKEATGDDGE